MAYMSDEEAAAIAAAYRRGDKMSDIVSRYCRSTPTIRRAVERFNVPRRAWGAPRRYDADAIASIMDMHRAGATLAKIKQRWGASWTVVERAIKEAILADLAAGWSRCQIKKRNRVSDERIDQVLAKHPAGQHQVSKTVTT